jgi:transcriptional regulator with XRE-family HTH domain
MWADWMEFFTEQCPECNIHAIIISDAIMKRDKLKLSQKDVARKSGVSLRKIKKFENCYDIGLIDLIKICQALEFDIKLISE